MHTNDFINHSNSQIINERKKSIINLLMIKYEDAFDFISDEPAVIMAKYDENSKPENYECIFRVRIWNCKGFSNSWALYSTDRRDIENIIIRKVSWNMGSDMKKRRSLPIENASDMLSKWPDVSTFNYFIESNDAKTLVNMVLKLDTTLEQGIVLSKNETPLWKWKNLEFLRLYDWGQIHFTWCPNKNNVLIETKLEEIISEMEILLKMKKNDIYSMDFIYELTPEEYSDCYIKNTIR